MKQRLLLFTIVSLAAGFGAVNSVQAQVSTRFVPSRPTMSPFFAYSAFNTTGLPNYYTYVLPAQQQAQQQAQYAMMTQTARATTAYDTRIALSDPTIGEIVDRELRQRFTTGVGAPARAATFQNYSHYYIRTPAGRGR